MARTFTITNGTDSVKLIDTAATGIIAQRHGFGDATIPMGVKEGLQIVEQWTFNMKGSSHDNLASQLQTLTKLIREAKEYNRQTWRKKPVYITQQTTNESNARYALVDELMEYVIPDPFDLPAEANNELEGLRMTIVREHPWRSGAPGVLPSASTLGATDGPSDPTVVYVSNHRDDIDVDYLKRYDASGTSYADISTGGDLFPASPAVGDRLLIGSSDGIPNNIVIPVSAATDWTGVTLVVKYWNGAFVAATYGDDFTVYPEPSTDESDLFETGSADWVINWFGKDDEASTTLDGDTGYWLAVEITAITSATEVPELDDTNSAYAQSTPEVRLPSALFDNGDSFPLFSVRMHSPAGGDEAEGPENITKILAGVKSGSLTNFTSHLNAGGTDNPGAWAVAQLTDATQTADTEAPGGNVSAIDFSTDSSMVARVRFTGTNLIDDYEGKYIVIVRAEQVGGDPGDIKIKRVVRLGSTSDYAPHKSSQVVATSGADNGYELIDLRLLSIPFGPVYDADTIQGDLIFEVWAERVTGSATLNILDLILLPYEEGMAGYRSVASADLFGAEAMRGGSILEDDAGLIAPRFVKYDTVGSNLVPSETWAREGELFDPMNGNLDNEHRIYFVLCHAPTNGTYGKPPLVSTPGQMLAVEVFQHDRFSVMRGAS